MALDGLVIVLIGVIVLFGYIFNKIINLTKDCLKIINKQPINEEPNILNSQPNQHE